MHILIILDPVLHNTFNLLKYVYFESLTTVRLLFIVYSQKTIMTTRVVDKTNVKIFYQKEDSIVLNFNLQACSVREGTERIE